MERAVGITDRRAEEGFGQLTRSLEGIIREEERDYTQEQERKYPQAENHGCTELQGGVRPIGSGCQPRGVTG